MKTRHESRLLIYNFLLFNLFFLILGLSVGWIFSGPLSMVTIRLAAAFIMVIAIILFMLNMVIILERNDVTKKKENQLFFFAAFCASSLFLIGMNYVRMIELYKSSPTASLATLVSVAAGLTHIAAFLIYNRGILFHDKRPSIVTWLIWGSMACLNATSYLSMSGKLVMSLLPITGAVMCVLTLIIVIMKKNFARPARDDYAILLLGAIAIIVWIIWDSATSANLIVLFAITLGFIPTYKSVLSEPSNEPTIPWFIWTAAFTLGGIVVILKWDGNYANLVYPLSMVIMHLGVALLSMRKKITI